MLRFVLPPTFAHSKSGHHRLRNCGPKAGPSFSRNFFWIIVFRGIAQVCLDIAWHSV
jgi:hypothetical protein